MTASSWQSSSLTIPFLHSWLLVVQEQLLVQADVALTDWPPQGPEVNPIENMWSKVKKTMHKSWPVLPLRNNDALWTLLSDDFLWSCFISVNHLIHKWVHVEMNEICGCSSGILGNILKMPGLLRLPYCLTILWVIYFKKQNACKLYDLQIKLSVCSHIQHWTF